MKKLGNDLPLSSDEDNFDKRIYNIYLRAHLYDEHVYISMKFILQIYFITIIRK